MTAVQGTGYIHMTFEGTHAQHEQYFPHYAKLLLLKIFFVAKVQLVQFHKTSHITLINRKHFSTNFLTLRHFFFSILMPSTLQRDVYMFKIQI